jgi:2-polyprenyl-6-hydroxyphenyl methylase/3-demethylubiquinone-9 3-methyltransferase
LRWLPRGTHDYEKFVRPAELEAAFELAGLSILDQSGVGYNPLSDTWSLSKNLDVNYMVVARKPPA